MNQTQQKEQRFKRAQITYKQEKNYTTALLEIDECIEKDNKNWEYLYLQTKILIKLGWYNQATNVFFLILELLDQNEVQAKSLINKIKKQINDEKLQCSFSMKINNQQDPDFQKKSTNQKEKLNILASNIIKSWKSISLSLKFSTNSNIDLETEEKTTKIISEIDELLTDEGQLDQNNQRLLIKTKKEIYMMYLQSEDFQNDPEIYANHLLELEEGNRFCTILEYRGEHFNKIGDLKLAANDYTNYLLLCDYKNGINGYNQVEKQLKETIDTIKQQQLELGNSASLNQIQSISNQQDHKHNIFMHQKDKSVQQFISYYQNIPPNHQFQYVALKKINQAANGFLKFEQPNETEIIILTILKVHSLYEMQENDELQQQIDQVEKSQIFKIKNMIIQYFLLLKTLNKYNYSQYATQIKEYLNILLYEYGNNYFLSHLQQKINNQLPWEFDMEQLKDEKSLGNGIDKSSLDIIGFPLQNLQYQEVPTNSGNLKTFLQKYKEDTGIMNFIQQKIRIEGIIKILEEQSLDTELLEILIRLCSNKPESADFINELFESLRLLHNFNLIQETLDSYSQVKYEQLMQDLENLKQNQKI